MSYIDLEPKTDRELLIMIVDKCNQTTDHLARINQTIGNHEKRIKSLETTPPHCVNIESNWKSELRDKWHILSLLASVIVLIILELFHVSV